MSRSAATFAGLAAVVMWTILAITGGGAQSLGAEWRWGHLPGFACAIIWALYSVLRLRRRIRCSGNTDSNSLSSPDVLFSPAMTTK